MSEDAEGSEMLDSYLQRLHDAGVRVIDTTDFWRELYPDRPPRQRFSVTTAFVEDFDVTRNGAHVFQQWGMTIAPDLPLRRATDLIWVDYCIRRGLPLNTPYQVAMTGAWAGVEIDITKSPRELRLVAPETYEHDFEALVWLEFSPAWPKT